MRRTFSVNDCPDVDVIVEETPICQVIYQILSTTAEDEELYYLKLEAIWLLTNLCLVEDDKMPLILASTLDSATLQ